MATIESDGPSLVRWITQHAGWEELPGHVGEGTADALQLARWLQGLLDDPLMQFVGPAAPDLTTEMAIRRVVVFCNFDGRLLHRRSDDLR